MDDDVSDGELSTRDWLLEQVVGEGPALIVTGKRRIADDERASQPTEAVDDDDRQGVLDGPSAGRDFNAGRTLPHELDNPSGAKLDEGSGADINSGAKRTAVWLGSGVLVVAVLIVLALVVFGGGPDPVAPPQHHVATPAVADAPSTASPPVPQQDHAVSFSARTDSCTLEGGSTDQLAARSPQALTDTATDSAWVCGRGPQESLIDGQVLHVQFTCDPSRPDSACSYMLSAVSVTSGWVTKTPGDKEEWLQHRVVTRLQFNFFNGNQLVADPFFLDTHSIHGPVPATLPAKVLASRVDVIILHTERPPAAPLPTTTGPGRGPDVTGPAPPGGLADSVLGPSAAEPATPPPADPAGATESDPVDATFAMSRMQFFGHSPT
jgi:hypothetical protein